MGRFLYDHKDHPNQHENNQNIYDEKGYLPLSFKENQWKLGEQHDQNSPIKGVPLHDKIIGLEVANKFKRAGL